LDDLEYFWMIWNLSWNRFRELEELEKVLVFSNAVTSGGVVYLRQSRCVFSQAWFQSFQEFNLNLSSLFAAE